MTGKIKALSLAVLAIAAMSAVTASVAQAGTLHVGGEKAVITGENAAGQEAVFPLSAFSTKCTSAKIEGTVLQAGAQTQTIQETTVTPTFSGCKLAGTAATFQTNGCQYTLTGAGQPVFTFLVDTVNCTAGKQMQVKTALCTVDYPAQSGLLSVVALAKTENTVTLEWKVSNTTGTQTGAACPNGNNHHTQTGSITMNITATAFQDSGAETVTEHSHQYAKHTHGSQAEFVATCGA